MENVNHQVIIGLPKSGKSTYIGALWQVLDAGDIDSQYTAVVQPNQREYINVLRESWFKCEAPSRTITGTTNEIELTLRDKSTNEISKIMFPDVDGEMYKQQFETRQIFESFVKLLTNATGILLFVNPNNLVQPVTINDTVGLLEEEEIKDQGETSPWEYKHCPTQVQLVDLLQIIASFSKKPLKLTVMVSAWDVIAYSIDPHLRVSPKEWIKKELPLLDQFLLTNSDMFESTVFGISAQGGAYPAKSSELQAVADQSKRIIVEWEGQQSNDITLPIKWLING
jgi:hypothetical protein